MPGHLYNEAEGIKFTTRGLVLKCPEQMSWYFWKDGWCLPFSALNLVKNVQT